MRPPAAPPVTRRRRSEAPSEASPRRSASRGEYPRQAAFRRRPHRPQGSPPCRVPVLPPARPARRPRQAGPPSHTASPPSFRSRPRSHRPCGRRPPSSPCPQSCSGHSHGPPRRRPGRSAALSAPRSHVPDCQAPPPLPTSSASSFRSAPVPRGWHSWRHTAFPHPMPFFSAARQTSVCQPCRRCVKCPLWSFSPFPPPFSAVCILRSSALRQQTGARSASQSVPASRLRSCGRALRQSSFPAAFRPAYCQALPS